MNGTIKTDLATSPIAQVTMTYRGRHAHLAPSIQIECELYDLGDSLAVHTLCPRCTNALWVDSLRKHIHFDPESRALHIDPFTCTWELGPDRRAFGLSLCKTRVAYDGHKIRDV